jgi:hypothetical protein
VKVRHTARSGNSIIEVAISTLLISVLAGAIVLASMRAAGAFAQSSATGDLEARAARAMRRVVAELIGARWSTITPVPAVPFGSDDLEFERPADTAGGAVTWGTRSQILLELASGEADNGLDDNQNGLIDERSIVLVRDVGLASQNRVTVVNGIGELLEGEQLNALDDNGNGLIDEAGLAFSSAGGTLNIRLTVQRTGPGGAILSRTQTMDLVLRNRI